MPEPRPPLPIGKSPVRLNSGHFETDDEGNPVFDTGPYVRQCDDPVHVFAEIPGDCQCGSERWEGPTSDDVARAAVVPCPEETPHDA